MSLSPQSYILHYYPPCGSHSETVYLGSAKSGARRSSHSGNVGKHSRPPPPPPSPESNPKLKQNGPTGGGGGGGWLHSVNLISLPCRLQSLEISPCWPLFLDSLVGFAACASWVAGNTTNPPIIATAVAARNIANTAFMLVFLYESGIQM